MAFKRTGITADRKTPEKISLIIANHDKMSRKDLSLLVGETPRWIKRQIRVLLHLGKIAPRRVIIAPSTGFWTDEVKCRVVDLRKRLFLTSDQIAELIKKEYSLNVPGYTVGHLLRKLGVENYGKREWLQEYLPKEKAEKAIREGMTVVSISKYLNDTYSVYISDGLILEYLNSIGLCGQKVYSYNKVQEKAYSFNKDWLEKKLIGHAPVSELCDIMGVSSTVVRKRIKQEGLTVFKHRRLWSDNLEKLRDWLLVCPPMISTPKEEDLHQMILGWLLGDGHLCSRGRFVTNHSLLQLDYVYLKYQVLRKWVSNVVTVPRKSSTANGQVLGGKEQIGISCPGFERYLEYLLPDGSKNYRKIMQELQPLGWACYYMDDGSFFSGTTVISMREKWAEDLANSMCFGKRVLSHALEVTGIEPDYIIPGFVSKTRQKSPGLYWEKYLPELYNPKISNDFSLSFVKPFLCLEDETLLNRATEYYHSRGFPYFSVSKEYLQKEWDSLQELNSEYLWKEDNVLRYADVGSVLFKNFMPHMVEAKYRQVSPKETFDGYSSLRATLSYTLKTTGSILPDFVYSSLIHFNGGVVGFPSAIAKAVVEKLSPEYGFVVDPCAGWGGRLLGTISAGRKYFGYEPWSKTSEGLKNLSDFCGVQTTIFEGPFDPSTAPTTCDLVFTSPPYIDLETYGTKMDVKSWKKLMQDIFSYAEKALLPGGYLALHLPPYLAAELPTTMLTKAEAILWHKSSRRKAARYAENIYCWRK